MLPRPDRSLKELDSLPMSTPTVRCALVVALLAFVASCRAEPPRFVERDQWASVRYGGAKIGFLHLEAGRGAEGPLHDLQTLSLTVKLRLSELGMPTEVEVRIAQWLDPATGRLVRLEALLPAGAVPTRKTITVDGSTVTVARAAYDGERTLTLEAPEDLPLCAEMAFLVSPLVEGESRAGFLNVMSDQIETGTTRLTKVEGGGWSVEGAASIGRFAMSLTEEGQLISGTGMLGVRLDAASEEEARDLGAADYIPPLEFGVGAKVAAPLPPPSRITNLNATLRGIELDEGLPTIEGRQTAEQLADGGRRVAVASDDIRRRKGPDLGGTIPAEITEWAQPDPWIDSDSEAVRAAAREAAGDATDASRAAERLCAWVDRRLTFGGAMDSARKSSEILAVGRGVCRDYAALYAGLARSLGIPTRLCTGLVYAVDGFYLHTWAESWLGAENGWVPLDPTRSGLPVDATHVTLLRGGVGSVWQIMKACGDLRVEDIEVEAAPAPPPPPIMPLLPGFGS